MLRPARLALLLFGFGSVWLAPAGVAAAEPVDWSALGEAEIVTILSTDEDGEPRETKTWIVVLDGAGYVRSTSRRLFANIERDPNVRLRMGERELVLHAAVNDEPSLASRVEAAHEGKYPDCAICKLFAFRTPRIVELTEPL